MALADAPIPPLPPADNTSRFRETFRSLRHRNFQLFFSGQMISLIGTWMQTIAEAWLVYRLTGSSLLLGTVGFVGRIPIFLFAPLGGLAADRWNRHKVVIGTQVASMILAFALAALTLLHIIRVWEIMALAALLGVVNAFDVPARQSLLIEMVVRDDLMNAIALNSSMFNGARIIGPAIAGILVARIGEGWCFFANAVSYIAVIIGLLMMKFDLAAHLVQRHFAVRTYRRRFPLRSPHQTDPGALVLLIGVVSLVAVPYSVLMPIFADQILHRGAHGLGILMGSAGVGALLGALTLAIRRGVHGLGRVVGLRGGGVRSLLDSFRVFEILLAVRRAADSGRIRGDAANVQLQHANPSDGAGRTARPRHGHVHHDVHGHGAARLALCRRFGRKNRRALDGSDRRRWPHSPRRSSSSGICRV